MNDDVARLAQRLLKDGVSCLSGREERVIAHIAKRLSLVRDVNIVLAEKQTLGDSLADRVAQFGGSWAFIIVFVAVLVAWIALNSMTAIGIAIKFDPYPYIFLNLILSMVAALQAPVILMSQNRQAARDRLAAGLDYEINLKAEIEIMSLHDKLDKIRLENLEALLERQTAKIDFLQDAFNRRA